MPEKNKRLIDAGWLTYRDNLLPRDLTPEQRAIYRRTYFAGAAMLWEILLATLEPGTEGTAADLEIGDGVQEEVDEFGAELDREVRGSRKLDG